MRVKLLFLLFVLPVFVFGQYSEQTNFYPSNITAGDELGSAAEISGDWMAIGAYYYDSVNTSPGLGRVFLWHKSGDNWDYSQQVFPPSGYNGAQFGNAIAIQDTNMIIGAWNASTDGDHNPGMVYFYHYDGTSWILHYGFVSGINDYDLMYGADVDIYGNYAIVGAPGVSSNSGRAYVYKLADGDWTLDNVLLVSTSSELYFGSSVQIYNDMAFVGAEGLNMVFQFQNDGSSWNLIDTIFPVGVGTAFGSSMDFDGTTLFVGDDEGNAVYAYYFDGTDWVGQKLTASDGTSTDYFGCDVSVSGDYAVVGAWAKNSMTGAAYIFKKSSGTWSQYQKIVASNGNSNDRFGKSVAIQNTDLVAGAFYDNPNSIGDYAGSAYLFQAPPPPAPAISQQPQDVDVCEGSQAVFTLTATDAESYQWCNSFGALTDGGDISGATTNQLTIANAEAADEDLFYCIVSNSVGSVISDTVTLTVDTLVVANAGDDMKICDGAATLNANTPSAGTGTWTVVGGSAVINDPNDPQTDITIYGENAELSWTIVNGACNSSDNLSIYNIIACFAPSPIVTQFPNSTIHIENNSSTDANSYLWDFDDGVQQTQDTFVNDFLYHYETWGVFTITLKAFGNDCFSLDTQQITVLAPDNIMENYNQINISPNPADNFITINGINDKSQIFIYNSNGKLLINRYLVDNHRIDISELHKGIYFLKTENQGQQILLKFVKK